MKYKDYDLSCIDIEKLLATQLSYYTWRPYLTQTIRAHAELFKFRKLRRHPIQKAISFR